ncbi:MAG TPA: serine hydrolase domain-containing protein, partial [Terriglobales bacterium]|nr:serine hydrolase domain-containing protein [Terriglobales bacterium]
MRILFKTALAIMLMPFCVAAQDRSAQIDAIFRPLVSGASPGCAVLVIKDGQPIFTRGYGMADLRTGTPIDGSTNFRLASLTKQFTATAVMLLVRDGKLHYDDPLSRFFPDFAAYGRAITLRQLLTHTSGLPDYEDLYEAAFAKTPEKQIPQVTDAQVVALLARQQSAMFPAGSAWHYSNSGYAVLAMIVERASGMPFQQFLQQRVFAPLGMRATVAFVKGRNDVPRRAYGYRRADDRWEFADQSPTSAVLGDGGMYSSLHDLGRWDKALAEHTLLSLREMQSALTPVSVPGGAHRADGTPVQYGFGWFLDAYKGRRRMYHDGETSGFRTTIQRFTDERLTMIILANRTDLDPDALAL